MIVPAPPVIVQLCDRLVGCAVMVTSKVPPLATAVENANGPSPVIGIVSLPLCSSRPLPARPVTVPAILYSLVEHDTVTLTPLLVIVPLPSPTAQVCHGLAGLAATPTRKLAPLSTWMANAWVPAALNARSSPPLFWTTRPAPDRPITVTATS